MHLSVCLAPTCPRTLGRPHGPGAVRTRRGSGLARQERSPRLGPRSRPSIARGQRSPAQGWARRGGSQRARPGHAPGVAAGKQSGVGPRQNLRRSPRARGPKTATFPIQFRSFPTGGWWCPLQLPLSPTGRRADVCKRLLRYKALWPADCTAVLSVKGIGMQKNPA